MGENGIHEAWHGLTKRPRTFLYVSLVLFAVYGAFLLYLSTDDGSFNPQQEPILLLRLPRGYRVTERVPLAEVVAFEVRRHRRNQMRRVEDPVVPVVGKKGRKDRERERPPDFHPLSTTSRMFASPDKATVGDVGVRSIPRELLQSSAMERIIVIEQYNMLFCPVPGVASRAFRSYLKRLAGRSDYRDADNLDDGFNTLGNYSLRDRERFLTRSSVNRVVFVRHPYERLASLYLHGNNTDDERGNQEFLLRVRGKKIDSEAASRTVILSGLKTLNQMAISLSKFSADYTKMDTMFWSVASLCSADQVHYNFVGQLNKLEEHLADLTKVAKLPSYSLPSREQLGIRPQNTTGRMKELLSDASAKKRIYKLYHQDFAVFEFPQ